MSSVSSPPPPPQSGTFRRDDFAQIHQHLIDLLQGIASLNPPTSSQSALGVSGSSSQLNLLASTNPSPAVAPTPGGTPVIQEADVLKLVQNLQASIANAQSQLNSLKGLDLSAEEQVAIAGAHVETLKKYRKLREDVGNMNVWRQVVGQKEAASGDPMEE